MATTSRGTSTALAHLCFSPSHATGHGPIWGEQAAGTAASSVDVVPRRFDTPVGHASQATRGHGVRGRGWTPAAAARAWSVPAPRRASRPTGAFNAPRGCRRGMGLVAFSPRARRQTYGVVPLLGYIIDLRAVEQAGEHRVPALPCT